MTRTAAAELRRMDRAAVQPLLPQLNEWLLPGALYGAEHTWPQLYRSDGDGRFLGLFAGDRLLAHCAYRLATVRTDRGPVRTALLGSVATDPDERGAGLATRLLQQAVEDCRATGAALVLLWAERPDLYRRVGFEPSGEERCCAITAVPAYDDRPTVRLAAIGDHARLHELHAAKPLGVERSPGQMSALLTTPGLWTFVLERQGRVAAYACTGKGADLQGWWHEVGGADEDVAALLPAAMTQVGQTEALVLLPPYRPQLAEMLAGRCRETATLAGPMALDLTGDPARPGVPAGDHPRPPACWIDGLDSV